MKNIQYVLLLVVFFTHVSKAQVSDRIITTGLPFLSIVPDARGAGMGDQGVATSADTYSQFWNPAKYSFHNSDQGFSLSYSPQLTALVNDVSLSQLTYFNKISETGAFSVGFRYYSLGEIEFRKTVDDQPIKAKPNELALDLAYSLKLSNQFAMAVAGRYINSNMKLALVDQDARSASAFSFDVAGFYDSKEFAVSDFIGKYRLGFNFQNIGPKVKYKADGTTNFLPSNLKLGAGFDFVLDSYNTISVNGQVKKLLVPSPRDFNNDGAVNGEDYKEYNQIGWSEGIFSSFGDAQGGTKEELQEVMWSLGAEYWYQESFALRAGYYHESQVKGAQKFYTVGAGFKYNVVQVDLAYLFSTSKVANPLEGTLRFSLAFNFDAMLSSKSKSTESN